MLSTLNFIGFEYLTDATTKKKTTFGGNVVMGSTAQYTSPPIPWCGGDEVIIAALYYRDEKVL